MFKFDIVMHRRFDHVKRYDKIWMVCLSYMHHIIKIKTTPHPHRDLTCDIVTPTTTQPKPKYSSVRSLALHEVLHI
jgi:hypothetical protein